MVLPQAMAWVQYWFRVLSLKFCRKSKKICGDISQQSPAFCMYAGNLCYFYPFVAISGSLWLFWSHVPCVDPLPAQHLPPAPTCYQRHHLRPSLREVPGIFLLSPLLMRVFINYIHSSHLTALLLDPSDPALLALYSKKVDSGKIILRKWCSF